MPSDADPLLDPPVDPLLRRLIGGDPEAASEVLDRARLEASPALLVAAALVSDDGALLTRATACATTTRDRQLVALAAAHLAGDDDRFDALVRDHLADHPDNVLAAWIASLHADQHHRPVQPAQHVQPAQPVQPVQPEPHL